MQGHHLGPGGWSLGEGEVEKPKLKPSLTFSYDGPGVTGTTPGENLAGQRESQADELGRATKALVLRRVVRCRAQGGANPTIWLHVCGP